MIERDENAAALAAEEERKKKKNAAALYYFTAAVADIVKNKEMMRNLARIKNFHFYQVLSPEKKQMFTKTCMETLALVNHATDFLKKKKEFFKLEPADEDHQEIKRSLTELKMTDNEYGTLCMCAAGDKIQDLCDRMMGRVNEDPENAEEQKIKRDRTKAVRKALELYRKGDRKAISTMLKQGLKQACKHFAATKKDEEAIEWSGITSEILYIYDQDPSLAVEGGINEKQMNIAKQVASLGNDIKTGFMAVNVLISAELDQKMELSDAQKDTVMDMALKMKTAIANKRNIAKDWDTPGKEMQAPEINVPQLQKQFQ